MIRRYIYEYKIPLKYFLILISPVIISFLTVFFLSKYKQSLVENIWDIAKEKIKMDVKIYKVPKIEFLSEKSVEEILENIIMNTYISKEDKGFSIKKIFSKNENKKKLPDYEIQFIYIGAQDKYVLINNKLYKEGDSISRNEKIIKIEKNRILLEGVWGKRWIYLINVNK